METLSWTTIDKSSWPRGPWDAEPDKLQWPDAATGLPCLIVRGPVGALCGYVGVPPDHPWHGQAYSGEPESVVQVHGGLTFSGACAPGTTDHSTGICHWAPGEPEPWWFGFDCSHAWDLRPGLKRPYFDPSSCYRDLAYVQVQVAALAQQLSKVESL